MLCLGWVLLYMSMHRSVCENRSLIPRCSPRTDLIRNSNRTERHASVSLSHTLGRQRPTSQRWYFDQAIRVEVQWTEECFWCLPRFCTFLFQGVPPQEQRPVQESQRLAILMVEDGKKDCARKERKCMVPDHISKFEKVEGWTQSKANDEWDLPPARILAQTTNLPSGLITTMSPNPTVVSVVNPKYRAVK